VAQLYTKSFESSAMVCWLRFEALRYSLQSVAVYCPGILEDFVPANLNS
jgi:hypothetical protein